MLGDIKYININNLNLLNPPPTGGARNAAPARVTLALPGPTRAVDARQPPTIFRAGTIHSIY